MGVKKQESGLFIYSANEDKKWMKVGESLGGVNMLKKKKISLCHI